MALGFALLGVFLPILPTTPFLLLAAACFARSSQRFYNWLMNNRLFGSYIRNYREGRGIAIPAKIFTLSLLWITMGCTMVFALESMIMRLILIAIGVGVTLHVILVKTYRKIKKEGKSTSLEAADPTKRDCNYKECKTNNVID